MLKLRDRDAIVTSEELIFRVYGYFHPSHGYICDVEYSSGNIYRSSNPRAPRQRGSKLFYKFYADEGLKFVLEKYPKYTVFYKPLQKKLVGIKEKDIAEIRKPEDELQNILIKEPTDELTISFRELVNCTASNSSLSTNNFGVFGSLLHEFYHPILSDLDLIIYGRKNLQTLRESLKESYKDPSSPLENEFKDIKVLERKRWYFKNYSLTEFFRHQQRKRIYAVYRCEAAGRSIKVEFEPVKDWNEIYNEYKQMYRISHEGWVKALVRITDDEENCFMPAIYPIEIVDWRFGPKVDEGSRIISYLEEFRMQAWTDELIYVEGNLERVETKNKVFHQITLTYGPRYYEQVLKSLSIKTFE